MVWNLTPEILDEIVCRPGMCGNRCRCRHTCLTTSVPLTLYLHWRRDNTFTPPDNALRPAQAVTFIQQHMGEDPETVKHSKVR